jgi:hypothetical protein
MKIKLTREILGIRLGFFQHTTGWTTGVRFPAGARDFSLSYCVQTGSGAHPACYPMGTGGPLPEIKTDGA